MICTEEAGMKKGLFRIIIPMMILAVWMIMCYPVCAKADGFDYFLYWIMVGCPYGIRKMSMFLVPKNFGIAGSIGILALDCIIGGLIGGMIVMIRIINTVMETSVYKGYKQDKIEMRGDRAEMSDFPLYLNMVAGGLDCRDQAIGGFSFVVKIYAVPVVEIIG